jgi:threonyl-tRNA synthetase
MWTPYVCVIGDREVDSEELAVRRRESADQVKMALDDLIEVILEKTKFAPPQELLLPNLITHQAIFSREV